MESFVFYIHYIEKMKKLPPEQAANLLYAICDYVATGTLPELDDTAADMCFAFIKTQLDKDIAKYEDTCKKRSEAGRRGAAATNGKRRQGAAKAANADLSAEEAPQPAPKSPEKKKYGEFVSMTEVEHQKLLDEFGPEMTARMIEVLDNYKGSKGKTYKSDYRAILNWVVERVKEEFEKKGGASYGAKPNYTPSTGFKRAEA